MPLSRLPFVAAATTSVKETVMSAYAGWRAFFFLKKVALDDWSWTELAEMFTLYLEQSPDSRAEIKGMAMLAVGGVLAFLAAHAAITYVVWRRKSGAMRDRIAAQTGRIAGQTRRITVLTDCNAVLSGSNDVLTGRLNEAEDTISILLEQGWQGQEVSPIVASKRRENESAKSGPESKRVEKKGTLGTGGTQSRLQEYPVTKCSPRRLQSPLWR